MNGGRAGGGEADEFGLAAGAGLLEHVAQVGPPVASETPRRLACQAALPEFWRDLIRASTSEGREGAKSARG
jgi:hypothetical protein